MQDQDLAELLREKLRDIDLTEGAWGWRKAAVLVPLVKRKGEWSIVFTRRSEELANHSGEISFPGGRLDEGESPKEGALREAHEELGIEPDTVEVLGRLPEVPTRVSGYVIEPWVGVIEESELSPNPAEIAEVIEVPVTVLRTEGIGREQRFIHGGGIYIGYAYDVGPNTVWGATGRITRSLLELLPEAAPGGIRSPVG